MKPKSLEMAVEELKKLPPEPDVRTDFYRKYIFPYYRKSFAEQAKQRPPCDLLITAVGTQPFSPALAIAATRPRICVLLTTHQTEGLVGETLKLSKHVPEVVRELSIGDGMDSLLVMEIVYAEYLRWGGGRPEEVIVDVTSGRKATVAALGAAASALRLRQAYVESELLPPNLGLNPRYHLLPDVTRFDSKRVVARALTLMDYGYYTDAALEFSKGGARLEEVAKACEILAASYISRRAAEILAEEVGPKWIPPLPNDGEHELESWRAAVRESIARKVLKR